MRRMALLVLMLAGLAALEREATAQAVVPINFSRGTLAGAGFAVSGPTALALGPDGRLYVAEGSGAIRALTIDPGTMAVTAVQQITTATDLREVYGIAFDPRDATTPPAIYVTNTISGFGDAGTAPPGSFPGKVTKISGPGYALRTDIITGLPISNSGHQANGLAFGPDGRLYIEVGSSTNAGVVNPAPGLFQLADTPLSGAIVVADVRAPAFNGAITYSPANTYSSTVNQTGGDVSVYAAGLRNPYGLVFHSNGRLYATDNGPNAGYGPASTSCSTDAGGDAANLDELNLIEPGRYYGHANRNRGRLDPRQCVYHYGTEASTADYTAPIRAGLPASSDGMAEYRAAKFGGQLQGDLLYAAWVNSELHRVKLTADGLGVVSDTVLASGLVNALAVAVDNGGVIFVAEYGANRVAYFKPDESPVSAISVTAINPGGGPLGGGQAVTISGTNFTTAMDTSVTLGGAALTNLVVQNSTTMTGVTPAHAAGLVDVTVTNSIGTATLARGYNYAAGGGTIPPVANAGPDITTPVAHEIHGHAQLDGRASYDPDGFIVSYAWTLNGTLLSSLATDVIQLTAGSYVVTLTVTDNDGFSAADQVRITVTAAPINPTPYFCGDVTGDGKVNILDLSEAASAYRKTFGQPGYARLRDWNADRTINVLDLSGIAADYGRTCPLLDRQIRAATVAIEKYQDVRVAQADGFVQITQFVPGQGRHMVKLALLDTTFDPATPEALLYEPDSSTPGGWRLGGALYDMPIAVNPMLPTGFDGTDDAWHYHDWLCFYPNGTVTLDLQPACVANGGSFQTKVGWLLHLWTYAPNPNGRFVEDNPGFRGLP